MRTTEDESKLYHLTIVDMELYCPITQGMCMADKCAMSTAVHGDTIETFSCGLPQSDAMVTKVIYKREKRKPHDGPDEIARL